MSRIDKIALAVSLLGIIAAALVADLVFERMPHIEDEIAYVWQARVLEAGKLTIPSPPSPDSFLVPFVIDYHGQRFGKYPLGWPLVLALGEKLGIRFLVNPILGGIGAWLVYLLGKRLFGEKTGLLATALMISSPFFLMNTGSLLSHPLGLVLSAGFALAWLGGFWDQGGKHKDWMAVGAGACLGLLAFTRPYTAVAVGFPFALHGLYLLVRGNWQVRRRLFLAGLSMTLLASLHFVWQYIATGNPLLNLYTLWWPYDKVGFGPGHGVKPEGNNLRLAFGNTGYSLLWGAQDLFGWGMYSWIFLPVGILAARRNRKALLAGSVFVSVVIFYLAYWVGSWLFGPRYYYEALYSLILFTAAGIAYLAGWVLPCLPAAAPIPLQDALPGGQPVARSPRISIAISRLKAFWSRFRHNLRARQIAVFGVLILLVAYNLFVFIPDRMKGMYGLYEMSKSDIAPFQSSEAMTYTPALIIVHVPRWMHYGVLLDLEDPFLTTPFIFTYSRGPAADSVLAGEFPTRKVFHYYPVEEPYTFYTGAK